MNQRGFEAAIVEGAKSQYDVLSNGQLVFSKQDAGRFPEHAEIVAALRTT